MRQIIYKSKFIIFFYSVLFVFVSCAVAIMKYNSKQYHALDMDDLVNQNIEKESNKALFTIAVVIVVLIVINVWSMLDYWVEVRKRNFYIRKVCGANKINIVSYIACSYGINVTFSILLTLIILFVTKCSGVFFSEYININTTVLLADFLVIIFGLLLICLKEFVLNDSNIFRKYCLFACQILVVAITSIFAISIYSKYSRFSQNVDGLSEKLNEWSYYTDFDDTLSIAGIEGNDIEGLTNIIKKGIGNNGFSFYRDVKVEGNEHNTFLYITDNVFQIYNWTFFSGSYWNEEYRIDDGPIPIVIGYDFARQHQLSVGDIYLMRGNIVPDECEGVVVGILEPGNFFLNPRGTFETESLDEEVIVSMSQIELIYPLIYLNQLNVYDIGDEKKEKILDLMESYSIKGEFRTMSDQLKFIKEDISERLLFYGGIAITILLLCSVSQITMILLLIERRKKEFAIRMVCGARPKMLFMKLSLPVITIIIASYMVVSLIFIYNNLISFEMIFVTLALSVVCSLMIMWIPCKHFFAKPIIRSLRDNS